MPLKNDITVAVCDCCEAERMFKGPVSWCVLNGGVVYCPSCVELIARHHHREALKAHNEPLLEVAPSVLDWVLESGWGINVCRNSLSIMKPLLWNYRHTDGEVAVTPFGEYRVWENQGFHWHWCGERRTHSAQGCPSIEVGKLYCEIHWRGQIGTILQPVLSDDAE